MVCHQVTLATLLISPEFNHSVAFSVEKITNKALTTKLNFGDK
jgi:hypothetical protein